MQRSRTTMRGYGLPRLAGILLLGSTLAACGNVQETLGLSKEAPDEFSVVRNPPLSVPPDYRLSPPRPGEPRPQERQPREQARQAMIGDRATAAASLPPTVGGLQPAPGTDVAGLPNDAAGGRAPLPTPTATGTAPRPGSFLFQGALADQAPVSTASAAAAPPSAIERRSIGETALLSRVGADEVEPDIRLKVNRESAILATDDVGFVNDLMFWRNTPEPGTVVDADSETRRLRRNDALGKPVTEGETPTIERKSDGKGISIF